MGGLFGSAVLDVALGMIFIYLLLSIVCTAANEWIAGLSKSRATVLRNSIRQLLGSQPPVAAAAGAGESEAEASEAKTPDPKPTGPGVSAEDDRFLKQFYEHPLVSSMMRDGRHPAYISARVFAKVVMDLVTPHKPGKLDDGDFERGVKAMPDGAVKRALLALIQDAGPDVDGARLAVEGWFEDKMDRASGWYKRRTQIWTVVVAVLITAAANADTLRMVRRLWNNPEMRAAFVEQAKARAQEPLPSVRVEYPDPDKPDDPVVTKLEENDLLSGRERALLGQVIGWEPDGRDEPTGFFARWLQRILGWLITVLAV